MAWFPTNAQGEIIRNHGDGSPVYACRTKEEAEQAKRCHLGATGPVIPLYAAPPPPADAEPKTLPVPTHVYLTDKAAVIVGDPQRGWDEEGPEAHNCDDMGCSTIGPHVLARVPFTVERPAAQQQQGQAVAWADEWRAAVAAKLSSYGLSEEAAAVFASSELDEYKAGLCDCAENDPVDMVDLMMGVARDAIEKWKIESAGRPFGHKNTAPPPSAPVGVEWPLSLLRAGHWHEVYIGHRCMRLEVTYDYATWERLMAEVESALAQQPAAVGEEIMVNAAHDVFTLPLQPSGLSSGPRFVVHVPAPEQPAAGAEALSHADLCRLSRVFNAHNVPGLDHDRRINEWLGKRIADALATEHQEPKKSKTKA